MNKGGEKGRPGEGKGKGIAKPLPLVGPGGWGSWGRAGLRRAKPRVAPEAPAKVRSRNMGTRPVGTAMAKIITFLGGVRKRVGSPHLATALAEGTADPVDTGTHGSATTVSRSSTLYPAAKLGCPRSAVSGELGRGKGGTRACTAKKIRKNCFRVGAHSKSISGRANQVPYHRPCQEPVK